MGLDIYVGPLTRYYLGNWETVVARAAREQGVGFRVIRANPEPPDKITDPAVVQQAVEGWRKSLEAGLREHLKEGLSWGERPDVDYFTDKPDWVGYSGVLLLAAYTEHPEFTRPVRTPTHWDKDPAYKATTSPEFKSRFMQLLDVELWLPCPFPFKFKAPDVAGNEVWIGSSMTLLSQLRRLNNDSFQGSEDQLEKWKYNGVDSQESFETATKFGLAMFLHHARLSVEHHLPMKLDY